MKTAISICSGGGLADIGLKAAGYTMVAAVEYDPAIAAVYAANHGDHVIVGDLRRVDYAAMPQPDLLWMSSPCPAFSVANANRGETTNDLSIADALCNAIEMLRPRAVIVENVRGYQASQSYALLRATLDRLDYWSHAAIINAADLGVPQTRERLILRAISGGWMQPQRPWPAPVAWRGWLGAIADLVPTLPDSAFAPWQLARLPREIRDCLYVGAGGYDGMIVTAGDVDPAFVVTANSNQTSQRRAFILDGQASDAGQSVTLRSADDPCYTLSAGSGTTRAARAWLCSSENAGQEWGGTRYDTEPAMTLGQRTQPRALLPPGRIVALTPRALARFQAMPDAYQLPRRTTQRRLDARAQAWLDTVVPTLTPDEQAHVHDWLMCDSALACRIIGNGVACEVARVAAETVQ
jgi:DNA-cytosine methyltransferase